MHHLIMRLLDIRATDSVKIDVLLNKEPIDALSFIAHRSDAQARARQMTSLLKKLIPRQNFSKLIFKEQSGLRYFSCHY